VRTVVDVVRPAPDVVGDAASLVRFDVHLAGRVLGKTVSRCP